MVTTMITAGSVRGNCVCPLAHTSAWPDFTGASGSPQRRAVTGDEQPLGQAERVEEQQRLRHRVVGQGGRPSSPRNGVHSPLAALEIPASTMTANQARPSCSPRSTLRPSGASAGETQSMRPSTGLIRVPDTTSTRVAGSAHCSSSQESSARCTAVRSWAFADGYRAGRSRRPRLVSDMSTHIGAQPGDIAPLVLMPGDPLRAKWIAAGAPSSTTRAATPRCAGCTATPAPGRGSGSRSRAPASANPSLGDLRERAGRSTTCSRSSESGRAAR